MYHRWAALALVLALWSLSPKTAAGQSVSQPDQQPRGRKAGTLGQNYPNPFNPETRINFGVACAEGSGGPRVVSLRIYNVLAQLVAIPIVQGPGERLSNMKLDCDKDYVAYWDGKVLSTGREAASGIYIYELVVDGERQAKKMFVAK
ncbi:MAG: hypothetical protein ABIP93_14280 [Gemmatimonadaceae bacterium]